ncbi:MAG: beta strand repeat-containing protein, partial [Tepidisphaeraceae bacterium]
MVLRSECRKWALSAAALSVTALLGSTAHAGTWSGAADGNWSNAANWDTLPGSTSSTTNTDSATFGASPITTVAVDANRNLQNIYFTGPGGSTIYYYTLNGGPLLLTSGGILQATSASGTGGPTINTALVLEGDGGAYTIQADTPGTSRKTTLNGAISGVSSAGNTTTLTLTGSSGGANTVAGVISNGTNGGNLALVKDGTSLWVMNSANATYTGGTTIKGGVLRLSASGNVSGSLGSGAITFTGGQLRLQSTAGATVDNAIDIESGNTGQISIRATTTFNPSSLSGTGTLNVSGDSGQTFSALTYGNFGGTVDTTGLSIFRFSTNYANGSLINAQLNLASGTTEATQFGTNGSQTIDIGSLTGAGSLGGSGAGGGTITYSIGNRADNTTFSGTVVNGNTKTGIAKVGTASLTLSGTNTYTGGTTVSGGTLVTGNNAALGAGTVNVTAGTLKVGNGTADTLGGITGLTMSDGASLALGGTDSAITLASGNFTLGAITLDLGNFFNTNGTYTLINGAAGSTDSIGAVSFA